MYATLDEMRAGEYRTGKDLPARIACLFHNQSRPQAMAYHSCGDEGTGPV
jgi:hypothetical protein